jgi:hypothetical protein
LFHLLFCHDISSSRWRTSNCQILRALRLYLFYQQSSLGSSQPLAGRRAAHELELAMESESRSLAGCVSKARFWSFPHFQRVRYLLINRGNWYWSYAASNPANTFRNQPRALPLNRFPYWSRAHDPNEILRARLLDGQQHPDDDRPYLEPVNYRDLMHKWSQSIQPAYLPDPPRSVDTPHPAISSPPWSQVIERARIQHLPGCPGGGDCHCGGRDSAYPEAISHNDDSWQWNIHNGRFFAPNVARKQLTICRPAKSKFRRRQSGFSRVSVLNEFTLAPRPTDWRPGYPARPSGLFRRLSRIRGERTQRILSCLPLNLITEPRTPRPGGGDYGAIRLTPSFYITIQKIFQLNTTSGRSPRSLTSPS